VTVVPAHVAQIALAFHQLKGEKLEICEHDMKRPRSCFSVESKLELSNFYLEDMSMDMHA